MLCVFFLCHLLSVSDLFSALMGSDSPAQEMMCRKQPRAPYDTVFADQPVCVLVCVAYISASNQSGVMLRMTVTNLSLSHAHTRSLFQKLKEQFTEE